MSIEDPGSINYNQVGGLGEQVRELREVIELPLINPELFQRVGINPPKGVLLYGPPGTGKTLLARAVASQLDANFLKVQFRMLDLTYISFSWCRLNTSKGKNDKLSIRLCPLLHIATIGVGILKYPQ